MHVFMGSFQDPLEEERKNASPCMRAPTLPGTTKAPENGLLEDEVSFQDGLFSRAFLCFRECTACGAIGNPKIPEFLG